MDPLERAVITLDKASTDGTLKYFTSSRIFGSLIDNYYCYYPSLLIERDLVFMVSFDTLYVCSVSNLDNLIQPPIEIECGIF